MNLLGKWKGISWPMGIGGAVAGGEDGEQMEAELPSSPSSSSVMAAAATTTVVEGGGGGINDIKTEMQSETENSNQQKPKQQQQHHRKKSESNHCRKKTVGVLKELVTGLSLSLFQKKGEEGGMLVMMPVRGNYEQTNFIWSMDRTGRLYHQHTDLSVRVVKYRNASKLTLARTSTDRFCLRGGRLLHIESESPVKLHNGSTAPWPQLILSSKDEPAPLFFFRFESVGTLERGGGGGGSAAAASRREVDDWCVVRSGGGGEKEGGEEENSDEEIKDHDEEQLQYMDAVKREEEGKSIDISAPCTALVHVSLLSISLGNNNNNNNNASSSSPAVNETNQPNHTDVSSPSAIKRHSSSFSDSPPQVDGRNVDEPAPHDQSPSSSLENLLHLEDNNIPPSGTAAATSPSSPPPSSDPSLSSSAKDSVSSPLPKSDAASSSSPNPSETGDLGRAGRNCEIWIVGGGVEVLLQHLQQSSSPLPAPWWPFAVKDVPSCPITVRLHSGNRFLTVATVRRKTIVSAASVEITDVGDTSSFVRLVGAGGKILELKLGLSCRFLISVHEAVRRDVFGFPVPPESARSQSLAAGNTKSCVIGEGGSHYLYKCIKEDNGTNLNALQLVCIAEGFPQSHRAFVWLLALQLRGIDVVFMDDLHESQLVIADDAASQIDKDIPRTFPKSVHLSSPQGQELLRLVLLQACHCLPSGYCQSLNFVAGILLLTTDARTSVALLRSILQELPYYGHNLTGVQIDIGVFDNLLAIEVPELREHFDQIELPLEALLSQWLMTMFAGAIPVTTLMRLWDLFFVYGRDALVCFAVALLKTVSHVLIKMKEMSSVIYAAKSAAEAADDAQVLISESARLLSSGLAHMAREKQVMLVALATDEKEMRQLTSKCQFTRAELNSLREVFVAVTECSPQQVHDTAMKLDGFGRIAKMGFPDLSEEEILQIFTLVDSDGDGFVHFKDLCIGLSRYFADEDARVKQLQDLQEEEEKRIFFKQNGYEF